MNAQTLAGRKVGLAAGVWYINAAIQLAAGAFLFPASGFEMRLVSGSNCQMIQNANTGSTTKTDTNIGVVGPSDQNAYFNGQPSLQTRQSNQRTNHGLSFTSVDGVTLKNFKIGANASAMSFFGGSNGVIDKIVLMQDGVQAGGVNQDGFDFGPGCHDWTITRVTGDTYDDVFSIFGKAAQNNTAMLYGNPWQGGADCYDFVIDDIQVASHSDVFIRLQAGNTFKCAHGRVTNCTNTLVGAATKSRTFLRLGPSLYITAQNGPAGPIGGGLPSPGDLADWTFDGIKGGFTYGMDVGTNCSDLHVTNWTQTVPLYQLMGTTGSEGSTFSPTVSNLTFDGVTDSYAGNPPPHSTLYAMRAGSTPSNIAIRGVTLHNLTTVDADAAGTTGLTLGTPAAPINIAQAADTLFVPTATSTGAATVIVGKQLGITFGSQTGLSFTSGSAQFNPNDVTPSPVAGSVITCANGKDPTGGSATQGGVYQGNGTAWVLQGANQNIPPVLKTGTFLSENFNDVAGTLLTAQYPDAGVAWIVKEDGGQVPAVDAAGTAIYCPSASLTHYVGYLTPYTADGYVEAVFVKRSTMSGDTPGVTYRVSASATTYYLLRWNQGSGVYQLLKLVAGTATVLGTSSAATFNVGDSHTLRLTCVGSTISGSVDGTQVVSVTDTAITAAGRAGLRWFNAAQTATTGIHVDNLVAVNQ